MTDFPGWLLIPGWLDLIDITVVASFAWLIIHYFRRTRARAAVVGFGVLGIATLLVGSL